MAPTLNRPRKAFWNIALFRLFCLHVAAIQAAAVSSDAVTLTASAQPGGDVCFGDVVQLTCSTRRDLTEYMVPITLWRENANPLVVTNRSPWYFHQTISSTRDQLTINVTSSYFNPSTTYSYQCYYRFPNITDDNSGVFSLTVGELLKPEATFTVVNSTTALLSASIGEGVCCTSLTILSNVSRNSNDSTNALVEETSTTSSRVSRAVTLGVEYNYTAEVVFRCLAPAMDQHTRLVSVQGPGSTTAPPSTPSTGSTEPSTTDTSIAVIAGSSIGGVLVALIVFIAGCVSGVLAHVLYQKMATKKSTAPPSSPPAPSYGHTQGDVGASPDMTDNPSYQLVERSQDSKQLYQNL